MTDFTYPDAYLAKHITDEREERAIAEVDEIATFPAPWRERLVRLRAYIIACLENQAQADDLFSQKLKAYREEWRAALPQAQAAVAEAAGTTAKGGATFFSIPLERS